MDPYHVTATILFCDIRNFTPLIEGAEAIDAVRFANEVVSRLGKEVEKNYGRIDHFTGDGFMAHFGISDSSRNHALDACRAAMDLRVCLNKINVHRYLQVEEVINIGVGIHTGTVAVGEISTEEFRQKTILGDAVNTTARIEDLTKFFNVDILMTHATYEHLNDEILVKKMPLKKLKGKKHEVLTYWLLPTNLNYE